MNTRLLINRMGTHHFGQKILVCDLRAAAWMLVFALAVPMSAPAVNQPLKPNIVILLADDLGYGDLGCFGSKTIRTPNLDKLATEGLRFTNFYAQPTCGPSRAALLTGRYPPRSQGWSMPATEITFAKLIKTVGYTTGCIGKWDVSSRKDIPGRVPNDQGFDVYWGPLGANDGGRVKLWDNRQPIGESQDMAGLSRTYTDKAIAFVEHHKDKPFLLYLCYTMPHVVIDASPAFKNRSGQGLYADTVEELDHEAGRLLDTLTRLGLNEKTLVLFTSDNGPWCNDQVHEHKKNGSKVAWSKGPEIAWGSAGPLREGKGSTYEGGVRVPCLARWPGHVPAGKASGAIFATIDFLPTFGNLAGYRVPSDRIIDGVNQTDLLLGQSPTGARNHLFYFSHNPSNQNELQAVRQGPWKLILPNRQVFDSYVKDRGTGGLELYNLDTDSGEKANVAPQNSAVVQELLRLSQSFR